MDEVSTSMPSSAEGSVTKEPEPCCLLVACRLSDKYRFEKPNDRRALDLMNAAAVDVMRDLPELNIAYGVSDEYRYV